MTLIRALIFSLIFFAHTAPAWAADETPAAAREIFESVLSPFCPGRLLRDCPSGAASELKHEITDQIRAGKDPEQVRAELFEKFGDSIRAAPEAKGFGTVAWIAPVAFLAVCGAGMWVWLRSLRA